MTHLKLFVRVSRGTNGKIRKTTGNKPKVKSVYIPIMFASSRNYV